MLPDRTDAPRRAVAPMRHTLAALLRMLVALGFWAGGVGAPGASVIPLPLAPEQRQWLAEHDGRIRIGITEIPPQVIRENDGYRGLSIDYIRLLEQRLGCRFILVPYATWNEVIEAAKARRIDMIFAAQRTPDRLRYLLFTDPYLEMPNVIFVRQDRTGGADLQRMQGWSVATSAGSAVHEYLKQGFPGLTLRPVADELTGLRMLALGEVDALVAEISRASYYIEKEGILNLRVAGDAGLLYQLRFAVRSDWPQLLAILDTGLDAVSEEERRELNRRWIMLDERGAFFGRDFWRWLLVSLGIAVLALAAAFAWNRALRRRVRQRTEQLHEELAARRQAEDALQHERALLARIMETSPVGISVVNRAGQVTFANRRAEEIFGLTKDEITQRAYNAPQWRITGFDGGPFPDAELPFRRVLATRAPVFDIRHAIEWPDGRRVRLSISGAPLLNDAGEVESVVFAIEDIGERARSERAVRESEQLFRALVENSPDYIARYDRTFRRIYVNPAIQRLFSVPPDKVIGSTPAERSPLSAPQVYIEHLRQVLETAAENSAEIPFRNEKGEMRWGHMRFVPEFGPDGKVASVLAIGRDIHEVKENELRFRTLAENFPDFIVRFDRDFRFTYVNPAVEKAFGLPASAIVGRPLRESPSPGAAEQVESLESLIRRAFVEGVGNDAEARWQTTTGERIFEVRHVPEKDATGNVAAVMAIAHDVTERRRAEQQRLVHLRLLEAMDRVNRAVQGTGNLEQTMGDTLEVVLSVFDCDRAFLLFPCDPDASAWRVPMERTKPEYPGVLQLGIDVPMEPDVAQTLRTLLAADGPVKFGPGTAHPLPADASERFGFKSLMSMAIRPKIGKPWQFGIHQCSHVRAWTAEEERLFQEIGRRVADALTTLLAYRDLQDSRGKLEEAGRIAHIGYWDRDLAGGSIELADESCRIFGIPLTEGRLNLDQWHARWLTLIHPEDRDRTARAAAAAIKGDAPYCVDYRIVRSDGEVRFIHSEANITHDASGRPIRMLGMMQDVTERAKAEQNTALLNFALDNVHEAAYLTDESARLSFVNDHASRMLGYTHAELLGMNVWDIDPDFPKERWSGHWNELRARRSLIFEARHRTKDGQFVPVEVSASYFEYGGRGYNLALVRDVTDRRRAENEIRELAQQLEKRVTERTAELEAANRELEAFAYSVSHDLRQPVRAIDGYRGLLAKHIGASLDDQGRRYLKSISDAATRMGLLIDDLLSFSRMGRAEMSKQRVALVRMVREVVEELAPNAAGRNVQWQIADLPAVTGDPAMLHVVFVNLLSNALKFTRSRPMAEIEVGFREDADDTVVFVRDNGVGFDMQYADKLFGVFQRLHGATEFEGTGIGLANVRRIVARHGGRTWAEGRLGEGATFYFSLPRPARAGDSR